MAAKHEDHPKHVTKRAEPKKTIFFQNMRIFSSPISQEKSPELVERGGGRGRGHRPRREKRNCPAAAPLLPFSSHTDTYEPEESELAPPGPAAWPNWISDLRANGEVRSASRVRGWMDKGNEARTRLLVGDPVMVTVATSLMLWHVLYILYVHFSLSLVTHTDR